MTATATSPTSTSAAPATGASGGSATLSSLSGGGKPSNNVRRYGGACFGTLHKQHNSATVPPNLASFSAVAAANAAAAASSPPEERATTAAAANNSSSSSSSSSSHVAASAMASLSQVLDLNERAKSTDFCVLVGNTLTSYDSFASYKRGDHPVSEVRIVGASAWNPHPTRGSSSHGKKSGNMSPSYLQSSLSSSPPVPRATFASEAVSTPASYQHYGGAGGPPTFRIVTYAGTHIYCSAHSAVDRDIWLAALHSGLEASFDSGSDTLGAITDEGVELSASGKVITLEDQEKEKEKEEEEKSERRTSVDLTHNLTLNEELLTPPPPQRKGWTTAQLRRRAQAAAAAMAGGRSGSAQGGANSHGYRPPYEAPGVLSRMHCTSCGRYPPDLSFRSASTPLPQYGMEGRVGVCEECLVAQGVLEHVRALAFLYAGDAHERAALTKARDLAVEAVQDVVQQEQAKAAAAAAAARKEVDGSAETATETTTATAATTNSWSKVDSEVVVENYDVSEEADVVEEEVDGDDDDGKTSPSALSGPWTTVERPPQNSWVNLPPQPSTTAAVLRLLASSEFATHRRNSQSLDGLCRGLESGAIGCAEDFLESLNDAARGASANSTIDNDGDEISSLKKEAFRVAGDMGTAMKLLHDYALAAAAASSRPTLPSNPSSSSSTTPRSTTQNSFSASPLDDAATRENTEMLACVLEFLLDLCEEGDLAAVAFFWPQLRQVHLQMLPPTDASSLLCVELMEDFLITVCVRYSVQLALELVWGCVADLEESLGSSSSNVSRRRRFALLRFVCELESLLFDLEGGWGGGSVSLRGMLSPSPHQAQLIKDGMEVLQVHRRFGRYRLTRSVRLDKLKKEAAVGTALTASLQTEEEMTKIARQKFRTARNADYFSSQIMFTRRLGDVAERLRFLDVEKRREALGEDLQVLNSSGRMGGDPINRLTAPDEGLLTVVHVPEQEGHVFRSKERTPVLLLMEMVREEPLVPMTPGGEGDKTAAPLPPPEAPPPRAPNDMVEPESPSRLSGGHVFSKSPTSADGTNNGGVMENLVSNMVKHNLDLPALETGAVNAKLKTNLNDALEAEPLTTGTTLKAQASSVSATSSSGAATMRRMSSFGSLLNRVGSPSSSLVSRREVLTTIFMKGRKSSNAIARGAAPLARRAVQDMDRQRAEELMNSSSTEVDAATGIPMEAAAAGTDTTNSDDTMKQPSEEDEAIEALRLLLIQNRVKQGNLTPEKAAQALAPSKRKQEPRRSSSAPPTPSTVSLEGVKDAGEVDERLAGCGPLSATVLSALTLWKQGVVSNGEVLELVQKDFLFVRQSKLPGAANETKLLEDSVFWGRFAFGERWAEKKARIAASSPHGSSEDWDLVGVIVKSNDDLRQEGFVMQLIELCREAFLLAGLELKVFPYRILATGRTTGIIEMVRNAMSFDALKKRPGYKENGGLRGHFKRMTEFAADPDEAFSTAQQNFVRSLAAYSVMSYFFLLKDRHNGNLLLDTAGHVIHIDFGFVFGIAPGGSFSLEQSIPFKLTEEMLEVMDGLQSPLFTEFVTLFCCGFLALQNHADTFVTLVEITSRESTFKCFEGKDPTEICQKLRDRFCPTLDKEATIAYALDLIKQATSAYGTKQYDYFQYLSQGIAS